MNIESFNKLDKIIATEWNSIHSGRFWTHLKEKGLDKKLYIIVMKQIFHYTSHNSQNQALVSINLDSTRVGMLKYVLHHALEEAGHDTMVIHDLTKFNITESDIRNDKLLPETEALISFLYWTALKKDPVARLGYSYWAESCYGYIEDLTNSMQSDLELKSKYMTFFIGHSSLDEKHFEEVKEALQQYCNNDLLFDQVCETALTTLRLTGNMLDACYSEYIKES